MGKVFERSLKYINLLILLLLLCGLAATWWYGWRTLPETDGTVEAAISAEGVIRRDRLGVPHIEAASIEDAMFLQGYATAQDRLWQLDALRRSTAGELAEVAGRAVLAADVEARRIGFQRTALVQAAQLDPKDRAIFASYARGVNHYIDTHRNRLPPEFTLLGYEPRPWTISDSVLVALRMAGDLSTSWKTDLDTERMRRELAGTFPELDDEQREQLLQRLYPVRDGAEALAGSNAWAISGAHTASGKPLLANDTHLAVRFPAIWTMVHLKAGKLNVKGFALPGLPGVIVGHNERIAWGTTNLGADVQDLYEERIDLASGRYQYGNEVRQASRIVETIRVRGEADQRLSVAVTHHGPLIHTSADPGLKRNLALRWTALAPDFLRYPFLDINLAGNWEEFRAALSRFSGPPQNFMYADVDGNIGYQAAGRIPLRRNGEGNVPLPGFLPTSEWSTSPSRNCRQSTILQVDGSFPEIRTRSRKIIPIK
jgi:penicillin amidase